METLNIYVLLILTIFFSVIGITFLLANNISNVNSLSIIKLSEVIGELRLSTFDSAKLYSN